ncbi:MAG: glycosyltransferase family 9 protein [Verrucomicrobiota bacterium]
MTLTGHERILVVKPSSLGYIVHTLPAVAALAESFPDLRIDWLANTEWMPILKGNPNLNEVIPFPRREFRGPGGLLRARKWAKDNLSGRSYDLALDFQGLLRSALISKLAGAASTLGFRNAREGARFLYDEATFIQNWSEKHAIERNLELVRTLGVFCDEVSFPLPEGSAPDGNEALEDRAILLHPFSRGIGKSLSEGEVIELSEKLAPRQIWLVGRADVKSTPPWPSNVVNFLEKTDLSELVYLIRRADWVVSVDSGPMHLAAGITDRVLSIHTWSDPYMVGPWAKRASVWRDEKILPVSDLLPRQYPEQRNRRKEFSQRENLLPVGSVDAIVQFLSSNDKP